MSKKQSGGGYCIPTLGVWDSFDEIDFNSLPDQFVLKCTHDSEGLAIVKDKQSLDKDAVRKKITEALKQNFYYIGREWPYKDVKPRIIAEQYMEDDRDGELRDYKFFCFNGVPRVMLIGSERSFEEVKIDFYDMNFDHLDIRGNHPNATKPLRKPDTFEEMKRIAAILSEGLPHVRVDFYEVNGRLFFGELTLYHHSGFARFNPSRWDRTFGDWLDISYL